MTWAHQGDLRHRSVTLVGGGWDPEVYSALYGPFLQAAGPDPTIACVLFDDGTDDADEQFARWDAALHMASSCRTNHLLVSTDTPLVLEHLDGSNGLLVGGGLTPGYAAAVAGSAMAVREWLGHGHPYAGFSAGAVVAAERALVGGWRLDGREICPPEAAEGLEDVTLAPGIGITAWTIDVHAAQWGTLGRCVAAVSSGLIGRALAIDENTALIGDGGTGVVVGTGAVHMVRRTSEGAEVRQFTSGAYLSGR
jgi:cyanophycinase